MADISKITVLSGTTYDIKDASARAEIDTLDSEVVKTVAQTLTDAQKAQARENITAADGSIYQATKTQIDGCTASGDYSHAEGEETSATGYAAHAEGANTTASGNASHAEGKSTTASALFAHAEGQENTAGGTGSHAEGIGNQVTGSYAHAEGNNNTVSANYAHAEGGNNTASGSRSHVEGQHSVASGYRSHAEGDYTVANHLNQHTFGQYNIADASAAAASARGNYVEIVGNGTADDARSNARTLDWSGNEALAGDLTVNAGSANELAVGAELQTKMPLVTYGTPTVLVDTTTVSFSRDGNNDWYISGENPITNLTISSDESGDNIVYVVEWDGVEYTFPRKVVIEYRAREVTTGTGFDWLFIGNVAPLGYPSTVEEKKCPFAITKDYFRNQGETYLFSYDTAATHTVKISSIPFTKTAVDPVFYMETSEGKPPIRFGSGERSTVEGMATNASGGAAHAEGYGTVASGFGSHADGFDTVASGIAAHAECMENTASGNYSHAEGRNTVASGNYSHAENRLSTASGSASHAEGVQTTASGSYSHAEGRATVASGLQSYAGGGYTVANHKNQHVFGAYNVADSSIAEGNDNGTYIEIVGNGTAEDSRSNARTLDWSGNEVLAGKLTVGAAPTNNMDVATKQYVDGAYVPATATPLMDGTAAVGTSSKYAREDHRHPTDSNLVVKNQAGNSMQIKQKAMQGVADVTVRPLINQTRANHLAFLPADQIIVEKTTDGGTTWVDAGFTDNQKRHIFAETRSSYLALPQIDGKKNILCGLRFTITGMKYNVPSGTAETGKYAYWNSTYVQSCERYFQLNNMYFWISSSNDTMSVKVERATGANPNTWVNAFNDSSYYMNGWSGADFVALTSPSTFGGGTGQTSNSWNWRITLMTRGVNGTDTMGTGYETQTQTVAEIRGYGDSVWTKPNEYMGFDKMYTHDIDQNVTFPAKVTANGGFSGNITGTATKATGDESGNNIKATYAASMSLSGNSLSISNKNGTALSTVTIPTELPAVTSSDNGKVLRVVNGVWAAASLPSASGVSF